MPLAAGALSASSITLKGDSRILAQASIPVPAEPVRVVR